MAKVKPAFALHFSGEPPSLEQTEFHTSDGTRIIAERAKNATTAYSNSSKFEWRTGVKALAILLLRNAAWAQRGSQSPAPILEGMAHSPANSLDSVLTEKAPAWVKGICGPDPYRRWHLISIISKTNLGRKRTQAPVRLALDPEQLSADRITVSWNKSRIVDPVVLDRMAFEIEHSESTWAASDKEPPPRSVQRRRLLHIPNRVFYQDVAGHESTLDECLTAIRNQPGGCALLLWGMGGIGKSTLAAELARRLVDARLAADGYWVHSPKKTSDEGGRPTDFISAVTESLITQSGLLEFTKGTIESQIAGLGRAGSFEEAVVVLDDVDPRQVTATESRRIIEELPARHFVITSRTNSGIPCCAPHRVQPLSLDDAVRFLRADAERRGLGQYLPKQAAELQALARAVGGVPFAMQLVLGRAARLPWDMVIRELPNAPQDLYEYLFRDLWNALSPTSQKLLISMRTNPSGIPIDELLQLGIGTRRQVIEALDELVRFALVNVDGLGKRTAKYGIHPLTLNFVTSDLPRIWSTGRGRRQ